MLPRPRSIFTLGEEGEKEYVSEGMAAAVGVRKRPKPASADLVGLRILIQCSEQESNVVAKPVVRSSMPVLAQARQSPAGFPEPSFLRACYLCKRKLSPQKDVYMYRGDQGFCSIECRCHQIQLDERRELEAKARRWPVAPAPRFLATSRRLPASSRRISAAA